MTDVIKKDSFIKTEDLVKIFTAIAERIKEVENKIPDLPPYTKEMKDSGAGHVLCEGRWDDVFPKDSTPLYQSAVTAVDLAKASVKAGRLLANAETPPELLEEVHNLLGDELFNELAAAAVTTQDIKPKKSAEEELQDAIADYYERKEYEELQRKAEAIEASELADSSDVEPKKLESK